jgi:hypothetical protein
MTEPSPLDDLVRDLGELGKGAVPVEDEARAAYRRERVVRALERKLADVKQSRRPARRRWALLAAAAAVLAVGSGFAVFRHDTVAPVAQAGVVSAVEVRSIVGNVSILRSGAAPHSAGVGELLRGGELVRTGEAASIDIGIESGRAHLDASSELEILQPTSKERRLRLGKGGVDVDLPSKLTRGERLVIETPDAEVLVVGTAFSVQLQNDASGRPVTSVKVRRGSVWVSHQGKPQAVLVAGQDWASPPAPEAVAARVPDAPARPPGVAPRAQPRGRDAPRVVESGTLAEENRLFETALAARNAGDHASAAEGFRLLLARFPRSILAEQALAGRFRALERAGRVSAAVISARRYLSSYPQGFARADAERITSAPLPSSNSQRRTSPAP